ncbi:MAG TPA: hypothetical protein VHS56_08570 [Candidatus Cybelea sp.]|jgi:predicted DNA-binding protein (UPF0251 family)|nr:hypothetical protein [Candidatus Cybelea sp.]
MRKDETRLWAAITLLRSIRNRRALLRHPLVEEASPRHSELADRLPDIVASLLDELSLESEHHRRRFAVLRRSDIERESHATIAREMSLSRSQFYRDLREARTRFTEGLEDYLALRAGDDLGFAGRLPQGARFVAIDALRDGGQFERARDVAAALARESSDAAQASRALCVRAELEIELGAFAHAQTTTARARALLADVADIGLRHVLDANCDLLDFEAAHCQGMPGAASARGQLIERLRADYARDGRYAETLVKALVAEASIQFERDEGARALATIDEAAAIIARARNTASRLAVDVAIRASGIRAVRADQVSTALSEMNELVETGSRSGNVRSLRLGMQMMAAHLLTLGRLEEAKQFALEAWALIDLFGSALDRVIVLSNLARIDIHRRDGNEALRWISLARAVSCDAFSITQALAISEAEALILVGNPERAAGMAHSLGDRVGNWPRLLGRAKLAEATALSTLRREREARECSEAAVEFSRGTAGPLLHLRALDLNLKLGGSSASRAELRDLKAALNA